jgi:hypothetical protein
MLQETASPGLECFKSQMAGLGPGDSRYRERLRLTEGQCTAGGVTRGRGKAMPRENVCKRAL